MVSIWPESGTRASFSQDGKMLATANSGGLIKLWSVRDRRTIRSFPSELVLSLAISPDGRLLAWGTDPGLLGLWDLAKENPTVTRKGTGKIGSVAFSPDSRLLATANQSHDIALWGLPQGQMLRTLVGHGKEVPAVASSHDGRSLASGGLDDAVMLWDTSGKRPGDTLTNVSLPDFDRAELPVFSPDGRNLAAAMPGSGVLLWEAATGHIQARPNIAGFPVAFSPSGESLFTRDEPFTLVRQWDLSTQSLLASTTIATPRDRIYDSAVSPDGKLIATSHNRTVILNDFSTGNLLCQLPVKVPARCLRFSADSMVLGTGHYDQTARLWDVKKRQVVLTLTGFRDTVGAVAFSAQGL